MIFLLAQTPDPLTHVWSSLAAAGPLALVLGFAVWVLWNANTAERDRHAKQEDEARLSHEAERASERERHAVEEKQLSQQVFDSITKIARAARKESSGES